MKHIAVLGAGVVGVSTAWYLRQAGYEVSVIEREPAAGMQTSFANGGQISVSHATPWANPDTPKKALKWLFKEDAPLLFRLRADAEQLKWTTQFLQQCTAKRADDNLQQMVSLGLYSRACLQGLRRDTGIDYQQQTRGIMHIYTNQREFADALAPTKRMQELGCERQVIDGNKAVSLEPALQPIADSLTGATYTSQDESGNAHMFTQKLAALCAEAGVHFLYNTNIIALQTAANNPMQIEAVAIQQKLQKSESNKDKQTHQQLQNQQKTNQKTNQKPNHKKDATRPSRFTADAFVVTLGCYSKQLVQPLGVELPIFPAKGYSATYQVNPAAPQLAPFVSLIDDEYKLVMSRLGDRLRVAGTAEFTGYNLTLNRTRCEAISKRVLQIFPNGVLPDSVEYWTGLRPMTPSNVPLIGVAHKGQVTHGSNNTHARYDNLYLNTGHGTLGWTHACGSAHAITQILQGTRPDLDFAFVGMG